MTIKDLIDQTVLKPMNHYRKYVIPSWALSKRPELQFLYLIDLGHLNAYSECYLNFLNAIPDMENSRVFVQFWLDSTVDLYKKQLSYFKYLNVDSYQNLEAVRYRPKQYTYRAGLASGYKSILDKATQDHLNVNWPAGGDKTYRPIAKYLKNRIEQLKYHIYKNKSSSHHSERKSV